MKVVVPFQENLSVPQACCICGAPNPTVRYLQFKEVRRTLWKGRIKLTFMKCQSCVNELKTVSLAASRVWSRIALRAVAIGGGLGLLAGIVLAVFVFQSGGLGAGNTNNPVNDLIGPLFACALIPAAFGMVAGLLPAWLIWRKRIDPATQQRLDMLKFPVKILDIDLNQTWFGVPKNPMVILNFASDAYGLTFMRLNHGVQG